MNTIAYDKLRSAFGARHRPNDILRRGLVSVDMLDAEDFVADVQAGKSIVELFHSAIPYLTFLSDEAAIFHLPDFLQIIADDRSQLVGVFLTVDTDIGHRVLSQLAPGERMAVLELLDVLKKEEDHEVMQKMLEEFAKLVKEPNQAPEPTARSGRGSA